MKPAYPVYITLNMHPVLFNGNKYLNKTNYDAIHCVHVMM